MHPETVKRYEREDLTRDEYDAIVNGMGREPNDLELALFGVMWSEHCSYKSSKATLAGLPTRGDHVLLGPGENAGIVDIGEGLAIAMKVESHNHPSAIEPYQGAATGVGGIIRDIFTMGARPIAGLNSLRFGELDEDRVRFLFDRVVAGIADYGNCVGIPTVGGEVFFDPAYSGNPLVNAMCVGVVEHGRIMSGIARGPGNPVLVVGSATGRDGIQGASFASGELTEDSGNDRPAVQVGDPFMEKRLIEATLEVIASGSLVGIQDMGAAGLTSSSCEMASRAGTGLEIDLSLVPRREAGMTPKEVMLSESQERMLVVADRERLRDVKQVCARWDLHAEVVGRVTEDGLLRLKDKAQVLAEVPARLLAEESPEYEPCSRKPDYIRYIESAELTVPPPRAGYGELLLELLASPGIASKAWVYRQYDSMVRTNTVVLPGSDAAVLRMKGTKKAIALSMDGNGRYTYANPRIGGMIAVAEAARNVVCAGARPMAVTDGLNFGNPQKPEIFWQFRETVSGIREACRILQTPVISGNVSFYNETEDRGAVHPTPIIGMLGLLEDAQQHLTQGFKDPGDHILLLGTGTGHLGCSEYLRLLSPHRTRTGPPPPVDLSKEKELQGLVLDACRRGWLRSAHDVSDGGLAVALAECCISGWLGALVEWIGAPSSRPEGLLFGEDQARIVITVGDQHLERITAYAETTGVPCRRLGRVTEEPRLRINGWIDLDVEEMSAQWKNAIPEAMAQKAGAD